MNEPFIPHTSAFACDDIARETVTKTYGDANIRASAQRFNDNLLIPALQQIVQGGKLRQGELRGMVLRLMKSLEDDKTVISATAAFFKPSKVSTKEQARITYVVAIGDTETKRSDWLDFVTCEVTITRTTLELAHTVMDFRMHRHALSRFMQRERKPAEKIMDEMTEALHMASLFSNLAICLTSEPHCAVPIGDGMLFGRIGVLDNETEKATVQRLSAVRREPPKEWVDDRQPFLVRKGRALFEVMTYVGDKQLTPNREKLRNVLRDFRERHADGLSYLFQSHYYKNTLVAPAGVKAMEAASNAAVEEAKKIIEGWEWRSYLRGIGTGPHG